MGLGFKIELGLGYFTVKRVETIWFNEKKSLHGTEMQDGHGPFCLNVEIVKFHEAEIWTP